MRQRDLESIQRFRREEQEREQREREERERPVREAQEQFNQNLRQLHSVQRERILTQKDDEFRLDPETTRPIPVAQYPAWQREQSALFKMQNPDYYTCPENEAVLVDYINRNLTGDRAHPGIKLVSAKQLTGAYRRLSEFGLLKERPSPEPVAEPTPEPVTVYAQPAEPTGQEGWDLKTGEKQFFTDYQIARMSADEFRKVFRLGQPRIKDVLV
jgi:hypothetical protein